MHCAVQCKKRAHKAKLSKASGTGGVGVHMLGGARLGLGNRVLWCGQRPDVALPCARLVDKQQQRPDEHVGDERHRQRHYKPGQPARRLLASGHEADGEDVLRTRDWRRHAADVRRHRDAHHEALHTSMRLVGRKCCRRPTTIHANTSNRLKTRTAWLPERRIDCPVPVWRGQGL
jgi:hypothetical protein